MNIQIQKAGLVVAAVMAALVAVAPARASASAEESSFVALRSIDAEALSPAEMQAITGENLTSIILALQAAATRTTSPTAASTFTSLAAAYSRTTTLNSRLFISRILVRQ